MHADPVPRNFQTTRDFLRQATQELHVEVERRVERVLSAPTTDSYSSLLTAVYGYYVPLEEQIAGSAALAGLGLSLAERRKRPLLVADLRHFRVDAASVPLCDELPKTLTTGAALGCLYVLEGSTLGGQVIARQVSESLNLAPGCGLSFFAGYGTETGLMWRAFLQRVEQFSANSCARDEIAAGARDCFHRLAQWLDSTLCVSATAAATAGS